MRMHQTFIFILVQAVLFTTTSELSFAKDISLCAVSSEEGDEFDHKAYFLLSQSSSPWSPSTKSQSRLYLHTILKYPPAHTETKNNRLNVALPKRASLTSLKIQPTKGININYLNISMFLNETGDTLVPDTCDLFNNKGAVALSANVKSSINGKEISLECNFVIDPRVAPEFSQLKNIKILTKSEKQSYQQSYWWDHPAPATAKKINMSRSKLIKSLQSKACRPVETERLVCFQAAHSSKKINHDILVEYDEAIAKFYTTETKFKDLLKELKTHKQTSAISKLTAKAKSGLKTAIQSKQETEQVKLTRSIQFKKQNDTLQKGCLELNDNPWKANRKKIKVRKKQYAKIFSNQRGQQ